MLVIKNISLKCPIKGSTVYRILFFPTKQII
nr:MAG TPA: hypothetical protein [Caudoviricetes sp.]